MILFVGKRGGVFVVAALMTMSFPIEAHAGPARRGFDLFALAVHDVLLRGNRVECNVNDIGEFCVDANNSPSLGGGFWPAGTGDQYVFNGGLQFGAIIPGSDLPNFPWPGDTIGAFFFDERGDQNHGSPLAGVVNSLNARAFDWPGAARAFDPSLFAPSLLGRPAVSNQDSWVRYWDGNLSLANGRQHPAGLMIDQRTMSFDTPGLEDVIFVVYRLVNITARDASAYQGLSQGGYSPDDIAEIAAIGAEFQDRIESRFHIQVPDGGYAMDSMYVSFSQDPDIGNAGSNFSNANLVFATSLAYKSDLREPTWQYPVEIFNPPFAQAPGFVANAFLRTPPSVIPAAPRIWNAGNLTGGAPFPSPVGVQRLWRNLSGSLLPTDGTCSVVNQKVRHFCFWTQTPTDTRFFMSTGPSRLDPGQSTVLVVAQVHAPMIQSVVAPFIGNFQGMVPGFPVDGNRLLNGIDTLRNVDRAAGWVSHADVNGNGMIDANEVVTTPRSLFWKIQAAQAALDRGFLTPSAPDAPDFYAVPGDHQVTIAWRPSATETTGDPYFQVAADPTSAAYDPDYRKYDVEGYRIWRGHTPSTMQAIAQFDHAGTVMTDYTGQFVGAAYGSSCAPELGVTTSCPVFPHAVDLGGDVVQVRVGDRVVLQNGAVAVLRTDTAVTGGGANRQPLLDTTVPLIWVDSTVHNGENWLYAVTAFDVNSARSGRSTLESPVMVRPATPRVPAVNSATATIVTGMFGSDGVTALDPTAPFPAIDSLNGTFNGIIPPADGGSFKLVASIAEALPPGDYTARIDSVTGGFPTSISPVTPRVYVTFSAPGVVMPVSFDAPFMTHADPPSSAFYRFAITLPLVPFDTGRAARAGIPLSFSSQARMLVDFQFNFEPISGGPAGTMLCGRGLITNANCGGGAVVQASRYLLHSRWYDEGQPQGADPTTDFNPSFNHNSGSLAGVTSIWNPMAYRVPLIAGGQTRVAALFRYYAYALGAWHPADYVLTWGAGGAISIRDSTHRTNLPYRRDFGAGYGFINGPAIAAAGVTTAQLQAGGELGSPNPGIPGYHALYSVPPLCDAGRTAAAVAPVACVPLSPTAVPQGLDLTGPPDGLADAQGIVLVINGESFFMQMASLPSPGTRWHLTAVGGLGMRATCTPGLGTAVAELVTPFSDCSGYSFTSSSAVRPAMVPGLQYTIRVAAAIDTAVAAAGLRNVHTVPDPYYFTNSLETSTGSQVLRFVNLPDQAIIRIYSAGGSLMAVLSHNDPVGGGEQAWDLRTRSGRAAASGVYFYHVEAADGQTKVGRFVVVNRER